MTSGEEKPQQMLSKWRLLVAVAALIAIVLVGQRHMGEFSRLSDVQLGWAAVMVLLFILARLVNCEILVQTVHSIGYEISRKEAFFLTILRTYASLLIPRAGFGAAGIYLKKKCGVGYAEYGALLLPTALMQCIVIGLLGLIALAGLMTQSGFAFPPLIATAFTGCVVFGSAALFFQVTIPESWSSKVARFLHRLNTAWQQLSKDKALLIRLLFLHVGLLLLRAARLQVAFWSIGLAPNFLGVLITSLLADLMFFISITPNAVGFRETAIVFGAKVSGVTSAESLVVAILDRVIVTGTVIVAAQIGLWNMPQLKPDESQPNSTP